MGAYSDFALLTCWQIFFTSISSMPFLRLDQRDDVEAFDSQNQTRGDSRSNCRKKRRRTDQGANNQIPELIDLTDVTDHDDTASVRVLDEIDPSPFLDSSIILDTNRLVLYIGFLF